MPVSRSACLVHAGQHGDRNHERRRPCRASRRSRCAASRAARIIALPPPAWTLTIQTPSDGRGRDGGRHRVRNVVELQIEEDAVAALGERPHERRPFGGEQAAADLEAADGAAKRVGQRRARARCVSTSSATRS